MKKFLFFSIYNVLYTVFLILSLPSYLIKMYKRGGYGTGLLQRFMIYKKPETLEPKNVIYVHAVSVGEVMIAVKWIQQWLSQHQDTPIVLATSTSTGFAVAQDKASHGVRVIYAPLDLWCFPKKWLRRFSPKILVLVEAELWPNMANTAQKAGIPIVMINARLSARSERRYKKVKPITHFIFSYLSALGAQDTQDAQRFASLGISPQKITITGSVKFDNKATQKPEKRPEFDRILKQLNPQQLPIILIASSHPGEEVILARAIRSAGGFPLIVPRHAERRYEVVKELQQDHWQPILRTEGEKALHQATFTPDSPLCYIADTTGELRDWTAHASIVIIGKSFLAEGGQNPAEAVSAGIPVITGPHMENFQAFIDMLTTVQGVTRCQESNLISKITYLITHPQQAQQQAQNALKALESHEGATEKTTHLIENLFILPQSTNNP